MKRVEYDERCGYCRNDQRHTLNQHESAVKRAVRESGERDDALLRAAKKQYDAP